MNSIYVEVVSVWPAQDDGTVYINTQSLKPENKGQLIQIASDASGKFCGETFSEGERFSATTELDQMNGEVPILHICKIKKRYDSGSGKLSKKDLGIMKGHGLTCAANYKAPATEFVDTAYDFVVLTQKIKKEYSQKTGVPESDYNLGQSVGLSVKLAAEIGVGKGMAQVERVAWWLLETAGEQLESKIRKEFG